MYATLMSVVTERPRRKRLGAVLALPGRVLVVGTVLGATVRSRIGDVPVELTFPVTVPDAIFSGPAAGWLGAPEHPTEALCLTRYWRSPATSGASWLRPTRTPFGRFGCHSLLRSRLMAIQARRPRLAGSHSTYLRGSRSS